MVLARIRAGKAITHFETIRQRKDGTLIPISLTVSPIHDDAGRVIGASKIARDISDRAQARHRKAAPRGSRRIVGRRDHHQGSHQHHHVVESVPPNACSGIPPTEAIGKSIRMLIPDELQGEEDVVLARIRAGEKLDHYETVRQRKDGTRLNISLTVSPIRNERGEIVGASKIARDVTERSRLHAAAPANRRANTEKLGEVGAIVASTLDRETIVQKVTDIATELTRAQFGAFFYNVTDPESGDAYMLYTLSGAPREAFAKFPASTRDGRVRSDVPWRGPGAVGRCDAGSPLRTERALSRDAARTLAGPQLPCGTGEGCRRGCARRAVLRPFRSRRVHRATRTARGGRGGVGIRRAGKRQAVRRGADRQPDEGRIPRRAVARAAHAAERHRRLLAAAARQHPLGRQGRARSRDARTKRDVADANRGGRARRLAHRGRQDPPGRAASRAAA